jgi:hypothetical protein
MRCLFILLFLLIGISNVYAQQLKLNEKMFDNAKLYYKTSAIPTSFRHAFKAEFKEGVDMASAGGKYNATDNISNPLLPHRRLLFYVEATSIKLMYYEHGGRGKHRHCIVQANNKIYSIDVAFSAYTTFEELKKYLLQNGFSIYGMGCKF